MDQERSHTSGDYKRLGKRIRSYPQNISQEDYQMLQDLRIAHKSSLAAIFTALHSTALKIDKDSVCTYRIKRIESIISKLLRFREMEVQRIADIAGCRCIMTSDEKVIELYERLKKEEERLPFVIRSEKNYIENPKKNGYRSIHLNVQIKDDTKKVVEIQLRSLDQHNWATLVEISDVLFQSKLKEFEDEINPDLYEFHRLLAKRDLELTLSDKRKISIISGKFRYLERLGTLFTENHLNLRAQRNRLKANRNAPFLLISTDKDGKPELKDFSNFDEAEKAYFEMFLNNPHNKNIVLTHFKNTTFDKISIAYSNYFMTYNETLFRILNSIADVSVYAFNHYKVKEFKKNYKAFWRILSKWFGEKLKEANLYNQDKNIRRSNKKKKEWTNSIASNVEKVNRTIVNMNKDFSTNVCHYFIRIIKTKLEKKLASKGVILLRRD
ncbi:MULTISPECIES: nucleotidyltransferase family protein [Porphyromonas]|uniref:hypothetical protein n=1 Tax=Porphyromonas TaxID=836 RepID=UPI0009B81AA1|nr:MULTISPECIES: hypothetical protein [Porphyromonas]